MKKNLTILILITLLFSCNAYKGINTTDLSIGMSKFDTQRIVKSEMVSISSNVDESGKSKEIYQVQKRIVRGGIARQQRYNLYFVDGKLFKYELADEKFSF